MFRAVPQHIEEYKEALNEANQIVGMKSFDEFGDLPRLSPCTSGMVFTIVYRESTSSREVREVARCMSLAHALVIVSSAKIKGRYEVRNASGETIVFYVKRL